MRECKICFTAVFGALICHECRNKFDEYRGKCVMCFNSTCMCLDRYIGLFTYTSVKSEILRLKYCGEYEIADIFSEISEIDIEDGLIWTCVPTTYKKLNERGYNASLVLCVSFAKKYNGEVNPFIFDMVERHVEKDNDKVAREVKNNRFFVNEIEVSKVLNRKIVIVDDVICTGATIRKLVELLRVYMKTPIICICVAKK